MEEKTDLQKHEERIKAVQGALDAILDIVDKHVPISRDGKLSGGRNPKLTITIGPNASDGSWVARVAAEKSTNVWTFDFDNGTGKVIDTFTFDAGGKSLGGKIHFDRPKLDCIESANDLLALITQVTEWKPAK